MSQRRVHVPDASLPSTGSSRALVPPLRRYYQGTATPCRPSRRTSLPSLGGTMAASLFRSRRREMRPRQAWSWSPGTSRRALPRRRQGLPSSWGTSIAHLHMLSDSGGTALPRPFGTGARPWVEEQPRLPRETDFRSSIPWLWGWLSTPHVTVTRLTAQDSLPGAGQALLDGLSTRKVPLKGFQHVLLTSFPPFPSLLGAILFSVPHVKTRREQRRGTRICFLPTLESLLARPLNFAANGLLRVTSNYCHLADEG